MGHARARIRTDNGQPFLQVHERNVDEERGQNERQPDEELRFGFAENGCQEQNGGHDEHENRYDDRYLRKKNKQVVSTTGNGFRQPFACSNDTFSGCRIVLVVDTTY